MNVIILITTAIIGFFFSPPPILAKTIMEQIIELAEQGDMKAQQLLGSNYLYGVMRYSDGSGVKEDLAAGMKWTLKAANQGHPVAQQTLGKMYFNGDRVKKDEWEAINWLEKSLKGFIKYENEASGEKRKRANKIIAEIQNMIGKSYYQECSLHYISFEGCESKSIKGASIKNHGNARKWFLKAAERGNPNAQYEIAGIYQLGRGTPQNYAEAVKWYQKSAENNNDAERMARYALGELYLKMKNYIAAHMWFNLASTGPRQPYEKEAKRAMNMLAERLMTPAQITKAQKMATEWAEKHIK